MKTATRSRTVGHTSKEKRRNSRFFIHPLFFLVGVWFCLTGELPSFLLSALVALQHELAHAFAAARLGYKLNRVVLMPYGAVIDVDVRRLSFKDELFVALCGPLANLLTALLFVAIWWLYPTVYAFTDTAYYASLTIALVNLLPAYPLDGGRILNAALVTAFERMGVPPQKAENRARLVCRGVTFALSGALLLLTLLFALQKSFQPTLPLFALFLLFGAIGNGKNRASYDKLDFSFSDAFERGVEIKRYALRADKTVKHALRFLSKGNYLVLEIYDERERYLGSITQNELFSAFEEFSLYTPLRDFFAA